MLQISKFYKSKLFWHVSYSDLTFSLIQVTNNIYIYTLSKQAAY